MSCAVEALVEQQMQMLGEKTYGWAQRLYEDYHNALAEFQARCESEEAERASFAKKAGDSTNAALMLSSITNASLPEDATTQFLIRQVEHLQERIDSLSAAKTALGERCRKLLQAILDEPEKQPAHVEQYQRLSEALAGMIARQSNTAILHETLADELQVLRNELESPIFRAPENAEVRALLIAQLTTLEALGVRQIAVAGQGLSLLRQRIRREMKLAMERQIARAQAASGMRDLVGDMTAKLQAITRQSAISEQTETAQMLLERLNNILTQPSSDDLTALRALSRETDELFTLCANTLEEQDAAEYLSDQVTDVLVNMGYSVKQLPAGAAAAQQFVADVDGEVGLQFRVDGRGRLGTKMVALNEGGAAAGQEKQEKICSLVDEIFAALRRRQCHVRERFRSSLALNEKLQIVQLPEQEEAITIIEKTPKKMRIEEV